MRQVAAGETCQITEDGIVIAVLAPPAHANLEELIRQGRARRGDPTVDFRALPLGHSDLTCEETLADLRGDR